MGCVPAGATDAVPLLEPLRPHTNEFNRNMVTLRGVVNTIGVIYDETDGELPSIVSVPGQSLDVHRMVSMESEALVHMRDGFRRLWAKSFESHACYRVSGGNGSGGMVVSRSNL